MFTCKDENRYAVYMLRNKRTGDAYIGSSESVHRRLQSHEISIRVRRKVKAGTTEARILEAFPTIGDVEFRILETVPHHQDPEWPGEENSHMIDPACRHTLREREAFWIRTLKPSLNRQVRKERIPVESLPHGAPNVKTDHVPASLANGGQEITAPGCCERRDIPVELQHHREGQNEADAGGLPAAGQGNQPAR